MRHLVSAQPKAPHLSRPHCYPGRKLRACFPFFLFPLSLFFSLSLSLFFIFKENSRLAEGAQL